MADDKQAIMEVFSRYLMCLDERRFNMDELSRIFTQDVKMTMPSKMPSMRKSKGLKEFRDIHATLFLRQFEFTHHVSSDYVFDFVSNENANVRCNLSVYHNLCGHDASSGRTANFLTSVVNFSVVLLNGCWLIKELTLKVKCCYRLPSLGRNFL